MLLQRRERGQRTVVQEGWETIVERIVAELGLQSRASDDRRFWGDTATSAADTVAVYRYILDSAEPTVSDFIMSNLHQAEPCASDGFNQFFGIPRVIAGAAYKQGWSHFGDPQSPCNQPTQPRADLGAAKEGRVEHVRALVAEVDLTSPAMHTTGTYANDRKIAALLTLQPDNTDWDTSAKHVTHLIRGIYKQTKSQPAGQQNA